jgi:hypothetical protein
MKLIDLLLTCLLFVACSQNNNPSSTNLQQPIRDTLSIALFDNAFNQDPDDSVWVNMCTADTTTPDDADLIFSLHIANYDTLICFSPTNNAKLYREDTSTQTITHVSFIGSDEFCSYVIQNKDGTWKQFKLISKTFINHWVHILINVYPI